MSRIDDTLKMLEGLRAQHEHILVAYSDGKDSRIVMDMALRIFPKVSAFYMFFVPGLRHIDERMKAAEDRYGIQIAQYPHWSSIAALKYGSYCDPVPELRDAPDLRLRDIYRLALSQCGAKVVLTGAKKSDSMWRRRFLHSTQTWEEVQNPIVDWSKHDVVAYLQARRIPLPPAEKGNATGVDLAYEAVLFIHDTYPDDFELMAEYFPYLRALVERRRLYGK